MRGDTGRVFDANQRRENELANVLDDVVFAGEVAVWQGWSLSPQALNGVRVTNVNEPWINFDLTRIQAWGMLNIPGDIS